MATYTFIWYIISVVQGDFKILILVRTHLQGCQEAESSWDLVSAYWLQFMTADLLRSMLKHEKKWEEELSVLCIVFMWGYGLIERPGEEEKQTRTQHYALWDAGGESVWNWCRGLPCHVIRLIWSLVKRQTTAVVAWKGESCDWQEFWRLYSSAMWHSINSSLRINFIFPNTATPSPSPP